MTRGGSAIPCLHGRDSGEISPRFTGMLDQFIHAEQFELLSVDYADDLAPGQNLHVAAQRLRRRAQMVGNITTA